MKKNIFIIALLSAVLSYGFGLGDKEKPAPSSEVDTKPSAAENTERGSGLSDAIESAGFQALKEKVSIVDFSLLSLAGETRTLSGLQGKVVFLNFWATWCPPCRAEMPSMQELYDKFKAQGLEILAVNVQEDAKTVSAFMKKNKLSFPVLLDGSGRIAQTYGVRGIPTSYLVDRNGYILGSIVGGKEWNTAETYAGFQKILSHGK
jgi:thiol-disulfide isomerase/thioredoxin